MRPSALQRGRGLRVGRGGRGELGGGLPRSGRLRLGQQRPEVVAVSQRGELLADAEHFDILEPRRDRTAERGDGRVGMAMALGPLRRAGRRRPVNRRPGAQGQQAGELEPILRALPGEGLLQLAGRSVDAHCLGRPTLVAEHAAEVVMVHDQLTFQVGDRRVLARRRWLTAIASRQAPTASSRWPSWRSTTAMLRSAVVSHLPFRMSWGARV